MDPATTLALANALILGLEQLIPILSGHVRSGAISVEEQKALLAKYESLRTRANGEFSGPHWEIH